MKDKKVGGREGSPQGRCIMPREKRLESPGIVESLRSRKGSCVEGEIESEGSRFFWGVCNQGVWPEKLLEGFWGKGYCRKRNSLGDGESIAVAL